jgi:hypothetical protein
VVPSQTRWRPLGDEVFFNMRQGRDYFGILLSVFLVTAAEASSNSSQSIVATCNLVSRSLSFVSGVFFPGKHFYPSFASACANTIARCIGAPSYADDNAHYTISSSQNSTCSVEPGSIEDVSKLVSIFTMTRCCDMPHYSNSCGSRSKSSATQRYRSR